MSSSTKVLAFRLRAHSLSGEKIPGSSRTQSVWLIRVNGQVAYLGQLGFVQHVSIDDLKVGIVRHRLQRRRAPSATQQPSMDSNILILLSRGSDG